MFKVSARNNMGAIGFATRTLEEALSKAIELTNQGMTNVTIHDPDGNLVEEGAYERPFNESQ